jgi:hypothetical protein
MRVVTEGRLQTGVLDVVPGPATAHITDRLFLT